MFVLNYVRRALLSELMVVVTIILAPAPFSAAAPFTPGNLLIVGGSGVLYEYSDTGVLLQTISVPRPDGAGPRDIVVDRNGNAQIWNGTFSPQLTTYDPVENAFVSTRVSGWSTVNNTTYGAIDALENYVFVTDMRTAGSGEPNGVVRINVDDLSWQRIDAGDVLDLDIGLDGLLYTLTRGNASGGGGTRVTAYEPFTGERIRSVDLPELRAIAVDEDGNIFTNGVRKYDPAGNLLGSISLSGGSDINISRDGRVLAAGRDGTFGVTDVDLSSGSSFRVPNTSSRYGGGAFVEAPISDPNFVAPAVVLPFGSIWKYHDKGANQGTTWRDPEFDDVLWAEGGAQLGYGDNDETTIVSFGPDPDNANNDPNAKFATTYFRHSFDIADASLAESLSALLLRDDAAAVYLNGVEVFRDSNLPAGAAYNTFATSTGVENGTTTFAIDPSLLTDGENVLAVEVHQASSTSSDISFDFRLTAVVNPIPEPTTFTLTTLALLTFTYRRPRRHRPSSQACHVAYDNA